ncbi:MAG: glycosyl transferase family 39, partial [Gallionella sp.]
LGGKAETGFIAALTFLAFFTTYRFGRPFLTNPPEVFWLFLPFFVLLYWPKTFQSRLLMPVLLGVSIGLAFLYKSFALGLPATLGLTAWYLHQRQYRVLEFIMRDALKVTIAICVAVAMFALWFALDPDPMAVWKEFIIGENVGKFDPHGPSYLAKLLWSGSSLWSYSAAFLTNAGLLTLLVVALFFVSWQRRREMSNAEQLLWLWIAALFFSFLLPSQRSGRYLLSAMPAVALLCALNWQHISRKVFIATLLLCGAAVLGLAMLSMRLQHNMSDELLYGLGFWSLIAITTCLIFVALFVSELTRPAVNVVALLVLLTFAAVLHPLDERYSLYNDLTQQAVQGKTVAVPCNFRAHDEGYRFLLPGADIVGYHESQHLNVEQLAQRYDLFAVQLPLQAMVSDSACAQCTILGERLDIRGRQSPDELRDMFLRGHVFEHLFIREVLMSSAVTPKLAPSTIPAEVCR